MSKCVQAGGAFCFTKNILVTFNMLCPANPGHVMKLIALLTLVILYRDY